MFNFLEAKMAKRSLFPDLTLANWQASRDTIHIYSRLLGKVRQAKTPRQKHWWHISLQLTATGLTTTPIPAGAKTFELFLDLMAHQIVMSSSHGDWWEMDLNGQSPAEFCEETLSALYAFEMPVKIDETPFAGDKALTYDEAAIETYWQAVSQVDVLLKAFKGELRGESSPVQLWPHHFDLALNWFSGRKVPPYEPENEEYADEQMGFGFSTGDEGIPNPYFYITAYPWPEALLETTLPAGAVWHTAGWKGALLMYQQLQMVSDPKELLHNFWHTAQSAGAKLMS